MFNRLPNAVITQVVSTVGTLLSAMTMNALPPPPRVLGSEKTHRPSSRPRLRDLTSGPGHKFPKFHSPLGSAASPPLLLNKRLAFPVLALLTVGLLVLLPGGHLQAQESSPINYLVSCIQSSLAKAGDVGQDLVGGLGPDKRFGVFVGDVQVAVDGSLQFGAALMHAAAQLLFGEQTEPALHQVQPGGAGGCEVHTGLPTPAKFSTLSLNSYGALRGYGRQPPLLGGEGDGRGNVSVSERVSPSTLPGRNPSRTRI